MNTLLIFLLGIIVIIGIARYNESNKLFWTLLISFLSGMAVASVYNTVTAPEKNDNKVTLTKSTPMCQISSDIYCLMKGEDQSTNSLNAKLVSKIGLNSDCNNYRLSKDWKEPILTINVPTIRGQCTKKLVYDTS